MKTFELPKEFTEKWLAALRSGNFKQAIGKLYDKSIDGYCCLGIACRVNTEAPLYGDSPYRMKSVLSKDFPNDLLLDTLNITEEIEGHKQLTLIGILTSLNDGVKIEMLKRQTKIYPNIVFPSNKSYYSFSEIADFIEQNVELV